MPRSTWNGALSFAGIDVPVTVFGAADPQGVQFRELHEPDGAEIAHELVDAAGRRTPKGRADTARWPTRPGQDRARSRAAEELS